MINIKDKQERANALKTFFIGGTFIMCIWIGFPYLIHKFVDSYLVFLGAKPVRWLGAILNCLGYALAVWCVMLFIKEGKGTPLPFAHPKKLVIKGPYRFVRNPMVLGTVLFLFGNSVLLGSVGIFIYAVIIFIIMHLFVLIEEGALTRRFGDEYVSYLQKTPRWLPKF
ncbi:MAG: isoprenylcysteine carboxylmethyltransferase family protein [Candidatus Omnitrophica bacterium]|nr:isoprenylcysteine carboxylmethyltransferase family protein [Candidatus Omnitrophota bacterium]